MNFVLELDLSSRGANQCRKTNFDNKCRSMMQTVKSNDATYRNHDLPGEDATNTIDAKLCAVGQASQVPIKSDTY